MFLALLISTLIAPADSWRTDRTWYDGLAEKCVYEATRTIYGVERRYEAIAYTNKELVDPERGVKSDGNEGIEAFKHHWSERVPTERYDYDFSTMSYTRVADLAAWKLTVSTQEDCGSSFKEVWRDDSKLRWSESVYFPGAGRREGKLFGDTNFFDALTLVLRGPDFARSGGGVELSVLPMQKDTHAVSFEPVRCTVVAGETSELDLPIGKVRAREVKLVKPDGSVEARYWFADDATPPMLNALVRFEGPQGITYRRRLSRPTRTGSWSRWPRRAVRPSTRCALTAATSRASSRRARSTASTRRARSRRARCALGSRTSTNPDSHARPSNAACRACARSSSTC